MLSAHFVHSCQGNPPFYLQGGNSFTIRDCLHVCFMETLEFLKSKYILKVFFLINESFRDIQSQRFGEKKVGFKEEIKGKNRLNIE